MSYRLMVRKIRNKMGLIRIITSIIGACFIHMSIGGIYSLRDLSRVLNYTLLTTANNTRKQILDLMWISETKLLTIDDTLQKQIIHESIWISGFGLFGLGASMSSGGFLMSKIGPCFTTLLGGLLMSVGVLTTKFAGNNIYLVVLTYGFIAGIGAGLSFSVSLSVSAQHFKRFKGSIIGVTLAAFGLGPFVTNYIANTKYVQADGSRYFLLVSGIFFVIHSIGSILLWFSSTVDEVESEEHIALLNSSNRRNSYCDLGPHQMIFEFDFWILWICFAFSVFGTILIFEFHTIAEILHPHKLSDPGYPSVVSFPNVIGVIFGGVAVDFFSAQAVITLWSLASCFVSAICVLLLQIFFKPKEQKETKEQKEQKDLVAYYFFLIIGILVLSGHYSMYSGVVIKRFGQKNFAKNFGIVWTAHSFAAIILCCAIINMEVDKTSFTITFIIISIMYFICFLLIQFYNDKSRYFRIWTCMFDNDSFS